MNKFIVTTTINSPTEATLKFALKKEWTLIVVGDLKTPHELYQNLNCIYLHPDDQKRKFPKLSEIIGWKTIQRRNIGFIEAYNLGADVIATVDDDNIPYENWGQNLYVGLETECDHYEAENGVFDPLSVTNSNFLWHRGYPVELISSRRQVKKIGRVTRKVLVQADLWNGDPDIDALARLTFMPEVSFPEIVNPYCSDNISPFNSQNTFLSRDVFPYYSVLPFIGRMDDIWGSYILQKFFPKSLIYNSPSVYQARNPQDLILNLENELFGYRNTMALLQNLDDYDKFLPDKTKYFLESYQESFL